MDGLDTHMTGTSAVTATDSQPSGKGSSHFPTNTSSGAGGTPKPVIDGYTLAATRFGSFTEVFDDNQSDPVTTPAKPPIWPGESEASRKALEAFNATTLPHGSIAENRGQERPSGVSEPVPTAGSKRPRAE